MSEERRVSRKDDGLLLQIAEKLDAHIERTHEYHAAADSSRREMKRDMRCLHDGFTEFREKYSAMLDDNLTRKKWWESIIEEQKKRSALLMTGVMFIALLYGLGHAAVYLLKKASSFIGLTP